MSSNCWKGIKQGLGGWGADGRMYHQNDFPGLVLNRMSLCMAPCVQRIVLWPGRGSGRYCFLGFDKIGMQRTPRHATLRGGSNDRYRYCDGCTQYIEVVLMIFANQATLFQRPFRKDPPIHSTRRRPTQSVVYSLQYRCQNWGALHTKPAQRWNIGSIEIRQVDKFSRCPPARRLVHWVWK